MRDIGRALSESKGKKGESRDHPSPLHLHGVSFGSALASNQLYSGDVTYSSENTKAEKRQVITAGLPGSSTYGISSWMVAQLAERVGGVKGMEMPNGR